MEKKLTPGEIVLLAAGVVALIASFLPWVDVGGFTASSWDGDLFFPVSTFVPLSAVVAAALYAVRKFTSAGLPENVLGFSLDQVITAFAFFGALLALGWVIAIEDAGIGFWLSVLATFAAVAGVVMIERDTTSTSSM